MPARDVFCDERGTPGEGAPTRPPVVEEPVASGGILTEVTAG